MLEVMVVGASGVFGSRLARQLADEPGVSLVLAGRRRARLEALAQEIGKGEVRTFDRAAATADDLAGVDLVIDCSGPFQDDTAGLVEAAIAAGCDYVDLADGRDWVAGFADRFDERARDAGVRLVAGASSIPALSHAAIDAMVEGWRAIDDLWVGIFPGNRTPRGLSVVAAILSYAGRPVRVFRDGKWASAHGWGDLHLKRLPVGQRWASVCDTPEQDMLVRRYAPRRSAEFFAGLELSLLHLGLWLIAWPVRWGLLASLRPAAKFLHRIAGWFEPFGTAKGGMLIEVEGEGPDGEPAAASWWLDADHGMGPYVPTLAALALVRRWRADDRPPVGAMSASGLLTLSEFEADFARLSLESRRLS